MPSVSPNSFFQHVAFKIDLVKIYVNMSKKEGTQNHSLSIKDPALKTEILQSALPAFRKDLRLSELVV